MKLFDVYPLFDIEIVKGRGCYTYDSLGNEYIDLYGGHAVISIGHSHPHYLEAINRQASNLVFYSNSVVNSLQQRLADKLGKASGYDDYQLFLINSGAEANENALKLASFHTGRSRIVAFGKAFHGRTSLAVEATDNPKIVAPVNAAGHVTFVPLNDIDAMAARINELIEQCQKRFFDARLLIALGLLGRKPDADMIKTIANASVDGKLYHIVAIFKQEIAKFGGRLALSFSLHR